MIKGYYLGALCRITLFLKEDYVWLHWALVAVHQLSLVATSGGYSLVAEHGFKSMD